MGSRYEEEVIHNPEVNGSLHTEEGVEDEVGYSSKFFFLFWIILKLSKFCMKDDRSQIKMQKHGFVEPNWEVVYEKKRHFIE